MGRLSTEQSVFINRIICRCIEALKKGEYIPLRVEIASDLEISEHALEGRWRRLKYPVFGPKRRPGKQPETVQAKECRACGQAMRRKRWANGRLETLMEFAKRQWCSSLCCNRRHMAIGSKKVGSTVQTVEAECLLPPV